MKGKLTVPGGLVFKFGKEVVIRVANDLNSGKFSNRQIPSDINAAVNVRCVRLAAAD